jgi:hypothetical protein
MTKQVFKQHAFNAGEISPRMYGRFDHSKYNNALKTATNVLALPQGPIQRRTGTEHVLEVKSSASNTRLIPFQFSSTDAFVLEFGNNYIRFYQDKANVESSGSPYEVTTTYTAAQVDAISYVQYGNAMYLAHPSHPPRVLTRNSTTDWDLVDIVLSPPPTYEYGYTPSQGVTLSATTGTGITATGDAGMAFLSGDVGRYLTSQDADEPGKAVVVGYTSATVVTVDILEDFSSTALENIQLDLSPIGDITITSTNGDGGVGEKLTIASKGGSPNLFRSIDVGNYLLMHGGVIKITEYTSGTQVKGIVEKSLNNTDDTSVWTLESSQWTGGRGYPSAVGLFQERLIFGGTDTSPQTLWWSEQGIFEGFGVGSDDEDSIQLDISSAKANSISWISSAKDLVIGTTGAEIALQASSAGPITPSNPPDQSKTYHGSQEQAPLVVGSEVLFIGGNSRKIRSFKYDFNDDAFAAQDLLSLADHFTSQDVTIEEMAYSDDPDSQIYVTLSSGDMLIGTYERAQDVIGWTKQSTDGSFEKVAIISENNEDTVYTIVNRTIDGSTVRYVEAFDSGDGTKETHVFSDSAIEVRPSSKSITAITAASPGVVTASSHGFSDGDTVYMMDIVGMTELNGKSYTVANKTTNTFELTNSSGNDIDTSSFTAYTSGGTANKQSTSISGLDHLEGETVEIKAEGAAAPSQTVASGSITLDNPAGIVVVGMPYTSTIKTLRYPFSSLGNSQIAGRVRWTSADLLVHNSSAPIVNGESVASRNGDDNMNAAVPLFSGFYEFAANEWDDKGELLITKTGPFPLVLLGIFGYGDGASK